MFQQKWKQEYMLMLKKDAEKYLNEDVSLTEETEKDD